MRGENAEAAARCGRKEGAGDAVSVCRQRFCARLRGNPLVQVPAIESLPAFFACAVAEEAASAVARGLRNCCNAPVSVKRRRASDTVSCSVFLWQKTVFLS